MEPETVELCVLPWTVRNDRSSVIVNLKHQIGRLQLVVAEQFPEDEYDVGHCVDRVVPYDHLPWSVDLLIGAAVWRNNRCWARRHDPNRTPS